MILSEKSDFYKLLQTTAEVYGKNLSESLLLTYWEDLCDYSFFDVRTAIRNHRRDAKGGKYMPVPADIIKVLKEKKVGAESNKSKCAVWPCVETRNLKRINLADPPIYRCAKHFEEHKEIFDIQVEMQIRAKQFEDAAKESGLTNQKYFEYHFGFDLKHAAKAITGELI